MEIQTAALRCLTGQLGQLETHQEVDSDWANQNQAGGPAPLYDYVVFPRGPVSATDLYLTGFRVNQSPSSHHDGLFNEQTRSTSKHAWNIYYR